MKESKEKEEQKKTSVCSPNWTPKNIRTQTTTKKLTQKQNRLTMFLLLLALLSLVALAHGYGRCANLQAMVQNESKRCCAYTLEGKRVSVLLWCAMQRIATSLLCCAHNAPPKSTLASA